MHTAEQTPKHFRVEKNMGQISAHGLELVLQPQPQPQRSGDLQCNGCSAVTRNLIRQACTTHVHMPLSTGAHCRVLWGFDHMAPCNLFGLLDLVSIDHLEKIWLHGSTPDKEAIDVRLLCQFITIRSADRSAVDNSDCHGDILAHGLGKPGSQILVHLLGLKWRDGTFARACGTKDNPTQHRKTTICSLNTRRSRRTPQPVWPPADIGSARVWVSGQLPWASPGDSVVWLLRRKASIQMDCTTDACSEPRENKPARRFVRRGQGVRIPS